ncbi:MAG: hypothetical protein RLY49_540 [Candidatus Parcubacteria bacterium]|jgi:hypothetical protein
MDNQIKTSFIPRKAIDTTSTIQTTPMVSSRRVGRTIFSIIATFIFLAAIGGSVLIYTWQIKLKKDIANQVQTMQEKRKSFDEKFVNEATRLNTRIESAKSMLTNHVSPSSLYGLLQEYTLQTVSFASFAFKDNQDGTITVSGQGEALRYESIVLQSDAFGKSGYLRNVIFTNLRPDDKGGRVGFTFEATLDPKLILYRNSIVSDNNQN